MFLREELTDDWLRPEGKTLEELDALLSEKQSTRYSYAAAA